MINSRQITISTGGSRRSTQWPASTMTWADFAEKLRTPVRSTETYEQYLKLPKSKQDDLKDVGGFVGGTFAGDRRKASAVTGRDLITLDLDQIPTGQTDAILKRIDSLGCAAVVYSTRKHAAYAPRLRVVFILDQTCTADEYEPIARKMAEFVGVEYCDPTTFEASRLMYWPSVSADAPYVYQTYDKGFLSKDGMLALYHDWHDVTEWPQVPGQEVIEKKRLTKQTDPTTKQGVVGAFCRTYGILEAMAAFIPAAYEPTETPGRYTYAGGTTTGGAVLYEGNRFLYSHHATDPCSGQLVNAWDMVRLHKFGDMDNDALPQTPTNKLPSYAAMSELALSDATVKGLIAQERYNDAKELFANAPEITDTDWMQQLEIDGSGNYAKTIDNIVKILENDDRLKEKFVTDDFRRCGLVIGQLPWDAQPYTKPRRWRDSDDAGLRWLLEKGYKMTAREKTYDATAIVGARKRVNAVAEYIKSTRWDGVKRLDTLFIDYLGAEDNEYTRAVTRKTLVAAVARALSDDGVKFDYMPIIIGEQGIGKSTMLSMLGKEWFSDSLTTFEGKDAAEMLQGTWINEIGELTALSFHDTNNIKQFLSKTHDIYRAAYGRQTDEYARRCIFIGTSNHSDDILKDKTGNRRFWPIDTGIQPTTKNVWKDLPGEVDQIWAEAYVRFMLGEPLYLTGEIEAVAKVVQAGHEETDTLYGVIEAFLEKEIPTTWDVMSTSDRRLWLKGQMTGIENIQTMKRKYVCAKEIYHECLGRNDEETDPRLARRINTVMRQMKGWKKIASTRNFAPYGSQRGFYRDNGLFEDEQGKE